MWDLPGPGLEPVTPALAGGFLTTAPPGKSQAWVLDLIPTLRSHAWGGFSWALFTHSGLLSSQEAGQAARGAGAGPEGWGEGIWGSVAYLLCDLDKLLRGALLFPFP